MIVAVFYLKATLNGEPLPTLNVGGALIMVASAAVSILIFWPRWMPLTFDWIRLIRDNPPEGTRSRADPK